MTYDAFVWHVQQTVKLGGLPSVEQPAQSPHKIPPEKDLTKMSMSGLAKLGIGRISRVKK